MRSGQCMGCKEQALLVSDLCGGCEDLFWAKEGDEDVGAGQED